MGGNGVQAEIFFGVPKFLAEDYPNLVKDQESFVSELRNNAALQKMLKDSQRGEKCGCTSTGFDTEAAKTSCGVVLMNTLDWTSDAKTCDDNSKIQIWATRPDWTMSKNGDLLPGELGIGDIVEQGYRVTEKELFDFLLRKAQAKQPFIAAMWEPHQFNFMVDVVKIPLRCDSTVYTGTPGSRNDALQYCDSGWFDKKEKVPTAWPLV
eukprot:TRINITY_DN399_c0_g2_i4.p1 TRINITY_DN399_c0_g2~~TRINITY_DN399_c0_g2_i4.p1  ORF type:complete len:208 (+),score=46.47 TRINITY_DN399_c0_g2_i4:390-1013(+)